MIGLGNWRGSVKHFLYEGYVYMNFFEIENGYDVIFTLDNNIPFPSYKILKIEEDGNKIKITVKASLIVGEAVINLTMNENTFEGYVSVPIIGNINVYDGIRLEEAAEINKKG